MQFSRQRKAPFYLMALSFLESFILPFPPPDVMLAPMALAKPQKALYFATLTLLASVLGGLTGYGIGALLLEQVHPFLREAGYQQHFETATHWFNLWGFWAVLMAGFSPVPYKIFTLSAGVLGLALIPFIVASVAGRGLRFFLLAWCVAKWGPRFEPRILQSIEIIGWVMVILMIFVLSFYYF